MPYISLEEVSQSQLVPAIDRLMYSNGVVEDASSWNAVIVKLATWLEEMRLVASNDPEAMCEAYGKLGVPQMIPDVALGSSADMINWVGTGQIDRENITRVCRLLRHYGISPSCVYVRHG